MAVAPVMRKPATVATTNEAAMWRGRIHSQSGEVNEISGLKSYRNGPSLVRFVGCAPSCPNVTLRGNDETGLAHRG
jgi:hypothetical protein